MLTKSLRALARHLVRRLFRMQGPPVHTDFFVALLAIHCWAARYAQGAHVVEVGCLAGDRLAELRARAETRSLRGYDDDRRLVASGRRRLGLDLRVANLSRLPSRQEPADLLLAVHALQGLEDPDATLDWMRSRCAPGGRAVVSLPLIVDQATMAMHREVPAFRSHRFIWQWEAGLRERFPRVALLRQLPPPAAPLDFSSAAPSSVDPDSFDFVEIAPAELDELQGLGIVFVAEA